eukprot:1865742-Pleurochrysis_carterae.AAC.1
MRSDHPTVGAARSTKSEKITIQSPHWAGSALDCLALHILSQRAIEYEGRRKAQISRRYAWKVQVCRCYARPYSITRCLRCHYLFKRSHSCPMQSLSFGEACMRRLCSRSTSARPRLSTGTSSGETSTDVSSERRRKTSTLVVWCPAHPCGVHVYLKRAARNFASLTTKFPSGKHEQHVQGRGKKCLGLSKQEI